MTAQRMFLDGREPSLDELRSALSYGHFTAMQVRAGRVRGLDFHLRRLDGASRELFGAGLPGDRVRNDIRRALLEVEDASVRVYGFRAGRAPSALVTVGPPKEMPDRPWRLMAVDYLRHVPHIKQVGGAFGQLYHHERASREGFDDALLTGAGGLVAETAIANVGFLDGTSIVWPEAPALNGITKQVIESKITLPVVSKPVHLGEIAGYEGAFVSNSWGVAPVACIDGQTMGESALMRSLTEAYEAVRWDPI